MHRYSEEWYHFLYEQLGDGVSCYRASLLYEGEVEDGDLPGCLCCHANVRLCLLPEEEKLFAREFNETDFILRENPALPGRKMIQCSKLGRCGGRKPYVCRVHPFHFIDGLVLVEESLCRLRAASFVKFHRRAVEKIRAIVYLFGIEREVLGYGQRTENQYSDYER